jgi:asparagine synthase (glutamine-hydrolysing)
MCGIAGFISENISKIPSQTVDQLRASILYRGRDVQQDWSDERQVVFLHSRLSIIDLTTGNQPMFDTSNRYVIVYNGEIYNYKELRSEYESRGARFSTQSDTEVILEGFRLKGDKVCHDLNGMFAFAIWDKFEKRLFLARDHLGKKPLYWYFNDGVFYFSSTIDSFRSIAGWADDFSLDSMRLYSNLGGFPEDMTIYRNVFAVPYATFCVIDPDEMKPHFERYWQMDFSSKSRRKLPDLLDEYEALLIDAVSIRLRSDVPLAITFSGGVDSGTIAAICAQNLNTSLKCYTIDYHTDDDPSEETLIAEKTARHLGLDWQYIHFDYNIDLLKDLPAAYQYYDQPATQIAIVYSHRLYEQIKPHATVVLSGNGNDELFTGYIGDEKIFQRDLKLARFRWARPIFQYANSLWPHKITSSTELSKIASFFHKPWLVNAAGSNQPGTMYDRGIDRIFEDARQSGVELWLDWTMLGNLTYATTDSNYRLPDITGLAAQVEVRSPFLDYRMVEFAARLPGKYKVGNSSSPQLNKYLPKLYYERKVPHDIAWASKKGMGMNIQFRRNIIGDPVYLQAFENAFQSLERAGIDSAVYRDAWNHYRKGNRQHADIMMAGFMLQKWFERDFSKVYV